MTKYTLAFLLNFLEMFHCFWMITWMKNVNNYQTAKVHSHVAWHLLFFFQFQPGVVYQSLLTKTSVYFFKSLTDCPVETMSHWTRWILDRTSDLILKKIKTSRVRIWVFPASNWTSAVFNSFMTEVVII